MRIPIEPGVPYLSSEKPQTGKNLKAFYKFITDYVDMTGVNWDERRVFVMIIAYSVDSNLECKYAPAVLDYSEIVSMYKYMTE